MPINTPGTAGTIPIGSGVKIRLKGGAILNVTPGSGGRGFQFCLGLRPAIKRRMNRTQSRATSRPARVSRKTRVEPARQEILA